MNRLEAIEYFQSLGSALANEYSCSPKEDLERAAEINAALTALGVAPEELHSAKP